jgi:PAS domain S-box-containing protein
VASDPDNPGSPPGSAPPLRGRRLIESQNEALHLIISGAPLARVFAALIAFVESEAKGEAVGCILLVDPVTRQLRHGAAPGLPDSYNQAVDGLDTRSGIGTCAGAAATSTMVVTTDIAAAPSWAEFKHLPLGLGLRAVWSMPILSAEGRVLGTFGTYLRNCRAPTEAEVEVVSMLAKTAALAIERSRAGEVMDAVVDESNRQQRLNDTVLSNTPDLVYVFDVQHRFTYANAALLSMWGRTWDESIGKTCLELGYEPWHAEMHNREIDQVVATRRQVRGEVAFSGTSGRRLFDYIFAPVLGASGEVEAIAGTTRDITDQRKATAATRFLADLTQSLVGLSGEAEIIRTTVTALGHYLDAHRCYFVEVMEGSTQLRVSENWVRDTAPSLAGTFRLFDFGGQEWWDRYSAGDFAVEDTENHPLIGASEVENYRLIGVRAYAVQPVKRPGKWTVTLAVTENHTRIWSAGDLGLLENVAARVWPLVERARSEAALRVARDEALAGLRAKDDFLAALSHELRTPLNPVMLIASDAAENPGLAPAVRADFATIAQNVALEARLIDDLLDLTRITHNKLPLELKRHDVNQLLREVIDSMQLEIREKGLQVTARLEAAESVVLGDDVRLKQVFWNLLRNAVKFTPAAGRLGIATRNVGPSSATLAIEFADTGIGVSATEMPRLFEPFVQGEHTASADTKRYGGLGLGLAIARKIAELHSGSISVRSAGRDQGATFVVELPVAAREASPPAPAPAAPIPAYSHPFRRVLLVEDHEASRQALAQLLAKRRIEVVQAASAGEALDLASQGGVDLVISDIGLPDGSGYDVMRAIKARLGAPGIALSGYGTEQDIALSRDAGFAAHLTKPVRIGDLDRALQLLAAAGTGR